MKQTTCAIISALILTACSSEPPAPPERSEEIHPDILRERARLARSAREAMAERENREAEDGKTVLLLVNGKPILKETVGKMIGDMRGKYPRQTIRRHEMQATELVIKDMLISQFLEDKAFRPTLDEIKAEVDRRRLIYEKQAGEGAMSFEEALRRQGASIKSLYANPTPGMRLSCYVRRQLKEEDVARTFETDRSAFDGTQVRVSHVLIDTRAVSSPEVKKSLANSAVEIRKRAADGAAFAELAKAHSDCPSRTKGGDLGFIKRHGIMVESFAAAAFKLKKGEVSPVIETQFGYHVIKATDIKPGTVASLDEVRTQVTEVCAKNMAMDIYHKLRSKAVVKKPSAPTQ